MAEIKKSSIKKGARGMLMGRGALEKFKDLIQTIKSEEGIDFGDDAGFDTLLEFYMNCVEEYNAMVDGEGPQFYASAKKSKMKKYNPDFPTWNVAQEELIEALNESNAVWDKWFNNSESGPIPDEINSPYNGIESDIEQLTVKIRAFTNILRGTSAYKRGYYASAKKSKMKKSLFDLEEELINKYPDVGSYFKVVAESTRNVLGSERYAEIKDEATRMIEWGEDKGYCMLSSMSEEEREQVLNSALGKSTKKSIPDAKMSFTDNVNKMRVNNYARTGNINTVMKKRD